MIDDPDLRPRTGPLVGLRVIELAGIGPGPFAAMVLADLGADVVRIDRPLSDGPGVVTQPRFDLVNRNRRSVVVDLRRPEGAEIILRLVESADVLVEGFRPGVTERLGIGPDACQARNPRLIYGRMTGWGQDGPLAPRAGHDIDYIALTGALHAMGRAGERPAVPLNLVGDFGGGGMLLVAGILAALWEAARSGRGQVVDAAIVDGASLLMTMIYGFAAAGQWTDERGTNILDTGVPWYEVYETADGRWMAVGALEDKFYTELVTGLGLDPAEADRRDPAGWPALRERFAGIFRTRTRDEWTKVFADTDACVAPVRSMAEAAGDPHVSARATFTETDGVTQPAPAPRFSRTPGVLRLPPPRPGEHTRAVLSEWGIGDVDALLDSGVVHQD